MAEQVRQTNTSEVQSVMDVAKGNTLSTLQMKDYYERQIAILQQRLSDLRHNYKIIQARILNNLDTKTLKGQNADQNTQIKPIQSFQRLELGFPNPNQLLSYNKSKLLEDDDLRVFFSELERIENEIKDIPARLKDFKNRLDKINTVLTQGQTDPKKPSRADLRKDQIARNQTANLLVLYSLHQYYYENTIDQNDKRAYPEDAKLLRGLLLVRQQFQSHARSLTNAYPQLKNLDLKDPGSDANEAILGPLVDVLRGTAQNLKVDAGGQKNINNLTSVMNDVRLSLGINRKPPPVVPADQSMRSVTKTYATGVNNLLPKSWSMPSYLRPIDAVLKWWRTKNAAT
jgi:hypothetical protein